MLKKKMNNSLLALALAALSLGVSTASAQASGDPVGDAVSTITGFMTPVGAGVTAIIALAALFVAPKIVKRLFGKT